MALWFLLICFLSPITLRDLLATVVFSKEEAVAKERRNNTKSECVLLCPRPDKGISMIGRAQEQLPRACSSSLLTPRNFICPASR